MAWERRERGGLYYTRSRKEGGRVVREYIGSGYLGQLAADLDAQERMQRLQDFATQKRERQKMEDLDNRVVEFFDGVEDIASAALLVAGYRKHNRGEWRKRREPKEDE